VVWSGCLVALLALVGGERRLKRLYYLGAWFLLALGTMAKGPAALAIPAVAVGGAVLAARSWREVRSMELPAGALVVAAVVLPRFVAMAPPSPTSSSSTTW
jgi:4-amino-4-deoxy-L-arabinose transferase-like glycosyltransferase